MAKEKSFFKRLTSALSPEEAKSDDAVANGSEKHLWANSDDADGELAVDVFETPTQIIIKALIAGVEKEDLEISISRDMVAVKGSRHSENVVDDGDYFHKELYWGSFSRTILLPQEVDIDKAEATEDKGLLTIRLPKVDKSKQAKLRVKSV